MTVLTVLVVPSTRISSAAKSQPRLSEEKRTWPFRTAVRFIQTCAPRGASEFVAHEAAARTSGVDRAPRRDRMVDLAVAEDELRSVQSVSAGFHGFDDDEVALLAQRMSVVEFSDGEQILCKGEDASWFGVLLRGELEAKQ